MQLQTFALFLILQLSQIFCTDPVFKDTILDKIFDNFDGSYALKLRGISRRNRERYQHIHEICSACYRGKQRAWYMNSPYEKIDFVTMSWPYVILNGQEDENCKAVLEKHNDKIAGFFIVDKGVKQFLEWNLPREKVKAVCFSQKGSSAESDIRNYIHLFPKILILQIFDLPLTSDAVKSVVRSTALLSEFRFHGTSINPQNLKTLLTSLPSIRMLQLGWNSIGDDGALVVTNSLKSMPKLVEVHIDNNDIGPDGLLKFAKEVPKHSNIQKACADCNKTRRESFSSELREAYDNLPNK